MVLIPPKVGKGRGGYAGLPIMAAGRKPTGRFPRSRGGCFRLRDGRGEKSPDGDFRVGHKGMRPGNRVCGSLFLCAPRSTGSGLSFAGYRAGWIGTVSDASTSAPAESSDKPAEEPAGDPVKLTMFVDETWWPFTSWKGAIPEKFNKIMNVEIEAVRAADDQQLTLMVSSGDMTDLVCSWRYMYMADSNVSYALDELHE